MRAIYKLARSFFANSLPIHQATMLVVFISVKIPKEALGNKGHETAA